MTAKHTPGPWKIAGSVTVYALNSDGFNRFCAHVQDAHTPAEELAANARLIAAAPDLLAALREMTALFEMAEEAQRPGTDSYTVLHQARAALSSATSTVSEG